MLEPMAKMAAMGFMSAQGGFLVAISNTVQPTLLVIEEIHNISHHKYKSEKKEKKNNTCLKDIEKNWCDFLSL